MITIPLTKGHVAIVDDEDAHLAQFKWCATETGRLVYATRGRSRKVGGGRLYLHREVMRAAKGVEVDHINGDSLDCRRSNLRIATHAQNMRNARRQHRSRSGYVGVVRDSHSGQWWAVVYVNGRRWHVGRFADPAAAARARDAAVRQVFGPLSCLNFPDAPCRTDTSSAPGAARAEKSA